MQDENKPATKLAEVGKRDLAAMPDFKIDMFSQRGFELGQRIARAFATSDAVPPCFQSLQPKKEKGQIVAWVDNPAALGNCLVAIETAQMVGMSITAVMQNSNIIEGKLSWSGQFKIGAVNASRRFTTLRFDIKNKGMIRASYKEKDGWNNEKKKWNFIDHTVEIENLVCIAWALPYGMSFPPEVNTMDAAKKAGLPVVEGPPVSMQLAVEEGWYGKAGSKWQTEMKHKMLTIRAGAYFSDIHAPDVVMGMGRTTEELQDMSTIDVERQPDGKYAANLDELRGSTAPAKENDVVAETVEVRDKQPEPEAPAEEQPARPIIDKESITEEVRQTYEGVAAQIQKAANLDALAVAADLIGTVGHAGLRAELTLLYKRSMAEFTDPKPETVKAEAATPAKRARRASSAAPE
jgi:hypothetical protein